MNHGGPLAQQKCCLFSQGTVSEEGYGGKMRKRLHPDYSLRWVFTNQWCDRWPTPMAAITSPGQRGPDYPFAPGKGVQAAFLRDDSSTADTKRMPATPSSTVGTNKDD